MLSGNKNKCKKKKEKKKHMPVSKGGKKTQKKHACNDHLEQACKNTEVTAANICKNCLDSLPASTERWKTSELCPCINLSLDSQVFWPPTAVTSEPCDLQVDKRAMKRCRSFIAVCSSSFFTLQHLCAAELAWSWTRTQRPSSTKASNWAASPAR